MAYVTYEEYVALYGEPAIGEQDFPVYAERASDLIDSAVRYRIAQGGGFSALPSPVQELVRKAAAAQVFYFIQTGLDAALTGQAGQSFTVGRVSVSGGALAASGAKPGALMLSPLALALLEQTPLMERGIPVCSGRFLHPFWGI